MRTQLGALLASVGDVFGGGLHGGDVADDAHAISAGRSDARVVVIAFGAFQDVDDALRVRLDVFNAVGVFGGAGAGEGEGELRRSLARRLVKRPNLRYGLGADPVIDDALVGRLLQAFARSGLFDRDSPSAVHLDEVVAVGCESVLDHAVFDGEGS